MNVICVDDEHVFPVQCGHLLNGVFCSLVGEAPNILHGVGVVDSDPINARLITYEHLR